VGSIEADEDRVTLVFWVPILLIVLAKSYSGCFLYVTYLFPDLRCFFMKFDYCFRVCSYSNRNLRDLCLNLKCACLINS
jgi:hypothetical protein